MAPPPKPKKRKPPHVGRPAYQSFRQGQWNAYDTYLWRRRVWTECRRVPDWMQKLSPGDYKREYEFIRRSGTKREERGAGPVKEIKMGVPRDFQRKVDSKGVGGGAGIERVGCEQTALLRGGEKENERSDELPKKFGVEDLLETPENVDEESEWVAVDGEDDFDFDFVQNEDDVNGVIEDEWVVS